MKKMLIVALICAFFLFTLGTVGVISLKNRADANHLIDQLCSQRDLDSHWSSYPKHAHKKYFHKAVSSRMQALMTTETSENKNGLPIHVSDAITLFGCLDHLGYDVDQIRPDFENFIIDTISDYGASGDFRSVSFVISKLDRFNIENDNIKISFSDILRQIQTDVFNGSSSIDIGDYIDTVEDNLSSSYYASILECFPYEEMLNYIKTNGTPVISTDGRGGFYDRRKGEFINESYWVDPLARVKLKKGEIGTYQYTKEHTLFGDFRVEIESEHWYQTPSSDPNNSLTARLYCKEGLLSKDYETITLFLRKINDSNCYYLDGMCFVLERDAITVMYYDMFTIKYE